MDFVRLHCPPKFVRRARFYDELGEIALSPKAQSINQRSYERYLKTEDGKRMAEYARNMAPEIGHVESFRIVCS